MTACWQASVPCRVWSATRGARWLQRLCLLVALLAACKHRSSDSLATLQLTLGIVERDFSAQPKVWKSAEVGASFGLGDGIQTRTGSTALLELEGGDQLSLEPNTLVRFASTKPAADSLDMEVVLGSVSVEAARGSLAIQTRAGPARIAKGARVLLSASPDGMRFLVQVGQAVFGAEPVAAGRALLIDAKGHRTALGALEPSVAVVAPGAALGTPPAPDAAALPAQVSAQVTGRRASVRTGKGWAALPEGMTQLNAGAELSLQHDTSVVLEQLDQRAVLQQGGRYVVAPRAGVLVAAAAGSLSAGSSGKVRIEVPGGVIEIVPQGRASIQVSEQRAQVDVQAREALLESAVGLQRVGAGERGTLLKGGKLGIEGRSLDYADVHLPVGESLVIHDPTPPTAVRFAFGSACPESGVVHLIRDGRAVAHATGREAVSLLIPVGSHRYELRCGADQPISATVEVVRDGGTRRIAALQPSATLQADGRDYTVLYQNRLPDITLLWRDAPAGTALSLVHEFQSRSETIALTEPLHLFASGKLAEGRHVLHFVGGGKISRRTTVAVVFDNAAPKVSISTPVSVVAAPGAEVTISGSVLPGWDVSIEGHPARRDAQGRFSLPVPWPHELRALSIRLRHPERGTHLYLRRSEQQAGP